jgi:hypothetical protein
MLVVPPATPWETNYQRQADEAFQIATSMSEGQLRALRPPLPQIQFLPPRFGYPSYDERQWGVMQVFGITRTPRGYIPGMPTTRPEERTDYSRSQSRAAGSDRLTNGGDPLGLGGVSW